MNNMKRVFAISTAIAIAALAVNFSWYGGRDSIGQDSPYLRASRFVLLESSRVWGAFTHKSSIADCQTADLAVSAAVCRASAAHVDDFLGWYQVFVRFAAAMFGLAALWILDRRSRNRVFFSGAIALGAALLPFRLSTLPLEMGWIAAVMVTIAMVSKVSPAEPLRD